METILVLLKNYQSPGEAFVVGALQVLILYGIIAIVRAIKNKKADRNRNWEDIQDTDNQKKE
ncbi:MAG: hypothetical protein K6A28_03280 [Bacteroidales bacterium]|nr:hypothetical protein [Bacteroidales bacterium]